MYSPHVPANPPSEYTGIDCSGFVSRCLSFPEAYVNSTSSDDFYIYARSVISPKRGDIGWTSGHVFIEAGNGMMYEANPRETPAGGNRVQFLRRSSFETLSIFPTFEKPFPPDNDILEETETVNLSITVRATGILYNDAVSLFVNGQKISDFVVDEQGADEWEIRKEDYGVSEGGKFNVRVVAGNEIVSNNRYLDEYSWSFIVNQDSTPPIVVSTEPSDGSSNVPVDKSVKIVFSKPMDQTVTANAVKTPFACSKSWKSETVLELIPENYLDYCEDYTITVTEAAMDTSGVHLDGNNDGRAGDNYPFTFTAEPPDIDLDINPAFANVEEGHSLKADLIANGAKLKKEINCKIDFDGEGYSGWEVSKISEEPFSLSPGEQHEDHFTVKNKGATAPLRVTSWLPIKCDIIYSEGFYWSAQGHQYDHPDENQSPGKMEYPTPWLTRTQSSPLTSPIAEGDSVPVGLPDIGILLSGWADGFGHIMGKYGIETLPVKPDLKIINNTPLTAFRLRLTA